MKIKMKAVGKKILLDPTPIELKTKSGIILQPKIEEKPNKGTVVSVGSEVSEVKDGDVVFFNKYTPAEIEEDGKKYFILKEEDIYTIVKK